jgi:hypothetical protein
MTDCGQPRDFANPSIDGVLPMMMMVMMMPVPVMMIPPVMVMIPPVVVVVMMMILNLSDNHRVFVTGSIGERPLILGS